MDWDNESYEADENRRTPSNHNIYSDEDEDEDDDYDEDEDENLEEFDENRLRRSRNRTLTNGDDEEENETVVGTFLFSMPFVFGLKLYQLFSSMFMLPLTLALQYLGFRVKKAPDTVSVREKKQAASMLLLASLVPLTPVVYMWMFFFLIFPLTTLPTAAYLAWIMYWDESPRNGSRRPLLKDVPLAKYFVEYFPITLWRKSVPLDSKRKYVFAYHPHGIIGLGSFGAFATHAAGFQEKFPGIDIRLLTLDSNFKVPIFREILMGFGVCSCSRRSCDTILQRGPGSAICLVVGGAAESLETQRGTYRLVLGRKGFVQVAVDNDADLVPVIAFGETDAFETFSAAPGTLLRAVQDWIQKKIKFTVPIFWGRGMFNTNFGMMPKRRPIHVVTGEPLQVKPFRDQGLEGEELVNAVHRAYIAALRRLFDENKDECEAGIKRKESLTIIK
jgi:2-acylglycerol O-acyltransferase 2